MLRDIGQTPVETVSFPTSRAIATRLARVPRIPPRGELGPGFARDRAGRSCPESTASRRSTDMASTQRVAPTGRRDRHVERASWTPTLGPGMVLGAVATVGLV